MYFISYSVRYLPFSAVFSVLPVNHFLKGLYFQETLSNSNGSHAVSDIRYTIHTTMYCHHKFRFPAYHWRQQLSSSEIG